eukprot:m.102078 g.102078  ORF g.102078 m.102078 type:complete len:518 (-) comp13759_c0_seq2:125-1678(-)
MPAMGGGRGPKQSPRQGRRNGGLKLRISTHEGKATNASTGAIRFAHASTIGRRQTMEDAVCARAEVPQLNNAAYFGVYDGHGGDEAAIYTATALLTEFIATLSTVLRSKPPMGKPRGRGPVVSTWPPVLDTEYNKSISTAFRQAHCKVDINIKKKFVKPRSKGLGGSPGADPGCTACTVLITQDHFVFANLGDSRAVLSCRGGLAFATEDHKPSHPREIDRICDAGGYVLRGRVCAMLAVARALGDHQFKDSEMPPSKQMVSPVPEITFVDRSYNEDFLLIACDGLFDVMSNEEVVDFILEAFTFTHNVSEIAKRLVAVALKRGSMDNISVVIVDLRQRTSRTPSRGGTPTKFATPQRRTTKNSHGSSGGKGNVPAVYQGTNLPPIGNGPRRLHSMPSAERTKTTNPRDRNSMRLYATPGSIKKTASDYHPSPPSPTHNSFNRRNIARENTLSPPRLGVPHSPTLPTRNTQTLRHDSNMMAREESIVLDDPIDHKVEKAAMQRSLTTLLGPKQFTDV